MLIEFAKMNFQNQYTMHITVYEIGAKIQRKFDMFHGLYQ